MRSDIDAGKPIVGLRTATHAFNFPNGGSYAKYGWNYKGDDYAKGFGKQILGETCFVHVERTGNQSWWRINERCMASFPSAAELIMGRLPQIAPWDDRSDCCGPEC